MTQPQLAQFETDAQESALVGVMCDLWRSSHRRSQDAPDRRGDLRIPAGGAACVRIPATGPSLAPRSSDRADARILDVSRTGMRVALDRSVKQGSIVMVNLRNGDVMAEVRYCRPDGQANHHLGLKVRSVV